MTFACEGKSKNPLGAPWAIYYDTITWQGIACGWMMDGCRMTLGRLDSCNSQEFREPCWDIPFRPKIGNHSPTQKHEVPLGKEASVGGNIFVKILTDIFYTEHCH